MNAATQLKKPDANAFRLMRKASDPAAFPEQIIAGALRYHDA
jgi:hypothetical protein